MSEARALTSVVGNGVATLAVAKWEGQLDESRARAVLRGEIPYVAAPQAERAHEPQDGPKPHADPAPSAKPEETEAAGSDRDPVPTAG
ncbi:hypothetical protein M2158_006120 [Streptomyces sp. SAI-144]|nr:hypothetical protein [Streptomyces sp. SAI-144]